MLTQFSCVLGAVALVLLCAAGARAEEASGLIPQAGRSDYPHFLSFRPADGQSCDVNPPRFSWPYLPEVIPASPTTPVPVREFVFQLSRSGDFTKPDLEIRTPLNFYNALPVLEGTRWQWRVGYAVGTDQERWSAARTFTLAPNAVAWDRTILREAAQRIAARPHPRLRPANGDWAAWRERLAGTEPTATWLAGVLRRADAVTQRPWWRDFPKSDRKGESEYNDQQFADIGAELVVCAFAYRLTNDPRYLPAKQHAVALARFPKGGLSSPEFHGAPRKWPTQLSEYLALCYDWWYAELSPEERAVLLGSLEWRLRAVYLEKASWRAGDNVSFPGVALYCQSHPFENFMWSLPGVLLTAGDLPLSDELTEVCLNYLTGVTSAHGPEEGWNEGLSYGSWKSQTMLHASLYTALVLPELHLERNPYYRRLGEWFAHLMPLGIQRLSFGDYAANPAGCRGVQRNIARLLARLTGDGRLAYRAASLEEEIGTAASGRPWLELFLADRWDAPPPAADEPKRAHFPEAGWVMAASHPPSDRKGYADAVGMIFQCRPRGGFSHSYRAENDFVWYAYGQTLSAGGGSTAYPDTHSRHSLSHNVVLVNGKGQEWDPRQPRHPFVGRLLAYREGDGFVHWVGDATHAYQDVPGLRRWHRHVLFIDEKWFVIFDDLAMRDEAEPARFSWLYHVAPQTPLTVDADRAAFSYRMGDVHARVSFAGDPARLEMRDQQGRDGFRNPVSGEDLYPQALASLERVGRPLTKEQWMAHNLWVTNRAPERQWGFLAALTAWRDGEPEPAVSFRGERVLRIGVPGGPARTVSFDPSQPGDITINLDAVRKHAGE